MFRARLKLNESADVDVEAAHLRQKAESSSMSSAAVDSLVDEFIGVAMPLVESGRLMKTQGSSFNVIRTLTGSGYEVQLEFGVGLNLSFFDKLKNYLFGR